jgi:hypothetical protein
MALTDNLISYWKLDEPSGNALDAHGGNTLTENGTVGSAAGRINSARDFEQADTDFFERGDSAELSTGDVDFTLQAWVNAESFASYPSIVTKGGASDREYGLSYESNRFRFSVSSDGTSWTGVVAADDFGAPSTGTWYHVVGWHDSVNNQIGISVNGVATTASYSGGAIDGAGAFRVGAYWSEADGNGRWDGLIDEVGLWKRVLSAAERSALYNGGLGLAYPFAGAAPARPRRPRHAEPAFEFTW